VRHRRPLLPHSDLVPDVGKVLAALISSGFRTCQATGAAVPHWRFVEHNNDNAAAVASIEDVARQAGQGHEKPSER
jgi:hypothetical protein